MDPFNQPLIEPLTIPNFEIRLKLVCKQILQYAHMYPLQPDIELFAKKISKAIVVAPVSTLRFDKYIKPTPWTLHLFYLVPSRTITYYSGRTVRYFENHVKGNESW